MEVHCDELRKHLDNKIKLGHELVKMLGNNGISDVQGVSKLEKKIRQEIKFLEKFNNATSFHKLKREHLNCSNLLHLESFVKQLFVVKNPTSVLTPFNLTTSGKISTK